MATHKLPPKQCSGNTYTFTDPTLTAGVIKVRNDHMEELRTQVEAECTRRGISAPPAWTDPALTALAIKIRNDHTEELRTQIEQVRTGRGESGYCPENTVPVPSWTDPTLTAGSIKRRNDHVTEMRTVLNNLKSGCICETEQCQYCADCGYAHSYCNHNGIACDDHLSPEGCGQMIYHYHCGSTNLAPGTTHPYKAASGEGPTTTAWDGYVPWDWCSYAPPGSNWGSCEYEGGHSHTDWNCKCNPFDWT